MSDRPELPVHGPVTLSLMGGSKVRRVTLTSQVLAFDQTAVPEPSRWAAVSFLGAVSAGQLP